MIIYENYKNVELLTFLYSSWFFIKMVRVFGPQM